MPISSFSYTYDGVGNRTIMNQQRSVIAVNPALAYGYDALNHLVQGTNPLPSLPDEIFNYDPVGNRLLRDGQTHDADFDTAILKDENFTYAYDANGHRIKKTDGQGAETSYSYDAEDQLVGIAARQVQI